MAAIIQARTGSSRLPGKILLELTDGKCVLAYLLDRLAQCRKLDAVIVATTATAADDVLADWLSSRGQAFFRGSERDCLDRTWRAAEAFGVETVVRITSDCPLVVPGVVDDMIGYYCRNRDHVDYLSNREFTDYPEGLDVEIFTAKMLKEAWEQANTAEDREHINYFFLKRAQRYRIRYFNHGLGEDLSRFKLSVDTSADLTFLRNLFLEHRLPRKFSLKELFCTLVHFH